MDGPKVNGRLQFGTGWQSRGMHEIMQWLTFEKKTETKVKQKNVAFARVAGCV